MKILINHFSSYKLFSCQCNYVFNILPHLFQREIFETAIFCSQSKQMSFLLGENLKFDTKVNENKENLI